MTHPIQRNRRDPSGAPGVPWLAGACLGVALLAPAEALAHAKGLYRTQAEAEQRARELGCKGTHQNNGLWMPCGHEAMLHRELRED